MPKDAFQKLNALAVQSASVKPKLAPPTLIGSCPPANMFLEYTTKEKKQGRGDFMQKLKADLLKCLDKAITGIPLSKISRIILCFNTDITAKEEDVLNNLLDGTKIQLEAIGLQTLAMELFNLFPRLAAQHLGVSVDTGQVMRVEDFIAENKRENPFATPLDNAFFFREEELKIIEKELAINEIVVLTGPPGVGKSRLALQVLSDWRAAHPEYDAYCLSNKHVSIFEDLSAHLVWGP
jgi:Cdc6-like AAA superfamily ATPase